MNDHCPDIQTKLDYIYFVVGTFMIDCAYYTFMITIQSDIKSFGWMILNFIRGIFTA